MLPVIIALFLLGLFFSVVEPLYINPKAKIPGPKLFALTKWRLALEDYRGTRTRTIHRLHQQYGPVVRIGPNEVHFNSLTALRKIYGAGSGFERTTFYRMFDVYGRQNLFTFHSSTQHGGRKKLLANAYSKSSMLHGAANEQLITRNVNYYMGLLDKLNGDVNDTFKSLHYYSLDSITHFLYGPKLGGTSATLGATADRALLGDVLDPSRRKLSWFAVHLPRFTKWLYTRTGFMEFLTYPILPMKKPATYTAIRAHAREAMMKARAAFDAGNISELDSETIIGKLFSQHHESVKGKEGGGLDDLDIASECADHLLAGIDTTADTLMFLFWILSLPENQHMQKRLIDEIKNTPCKLDQYGNPTTGSTDKLVYLDAVIRETLRLFAPLPASEPRCLPNTSSVIDDYTIPAGTVVSVSPYSIHRNEEVFPDPLKFKPERWLGAPGDSDLAGAEAAKWFWAFSSGGRMCIGLQ